MAASFLLLATLAAAVGGCSLPYRFGLVAPHPYIDEGLRAELRTAGELQPDALVDQPATPLSEAPTEPVAEIVAKARSVAEPGEEKEVVELTLAEVRRDALQFNLNLQVDLHNPLITEQGYESELWKFESVLAASQSHNTSIDGQGAETDTAAFDTAIRVPTRVGGVATIGLPVSRADFDDAAFNPRLNAFGGRTDTLGLQLGVSQPLLRNFGVSVNHASINVAGLVMMQADARTRLSAIRVLANAEQAYWLNYAAHANLKIQLSLYDLALEQLRMSRRLVEEGARTKVEITRAESGVAQRYEQIVVAELNRRLTQRALKRVMNNPELPVDGVTIVIPATPPNPQGYVFDRPGVLDIAYNNRMELLDNEFQQRIDQLTIGVNRNSILPDVRLDFRYAFAGDGSVLDDAATRLFRPDLDSYTVGMTAEIPIQGNQAARARHRQSLLTLSQTRAFQRAITIGITEEVENAMDAVEQTWHRILANQIAVATAQRTYEAERISFEAEESTNTEVFVQLSNLAQAQSLLIQSFADFQRALGDLAFATGTILGQSGVIWGPPNELSCSFCPPERVHTVAAPYPIPPVEFEMPIAPPEDIPAPPPVHD